MSINLWGLFIRIFAFKIDGGISAKSYDFSTSSATIFFESCDFFQNQIIYMLFLNVSNCTWLQEIDRLSMFLL